MTTQLNQNCVTQIRERLTSLLISNRGGQPRAPESSAVDLLNTLEGVLDEAANYAVEITEILTTWRAPAPVLCAAQIHKIARALDISPDVITQRCGSYTALLCSEYARIFSVRVDDDRGNPAARYRSQLFQAAYADPALGLLLAADAWRKFASLRSHYAGTLHTLSPHFIDEARNAIRPFLEMMGLQALREELEQWLWQIQGTECTRAAALNRELFEDVEKQLQESLAPVSSNYAIRYHKFSLLNDTGARSVTDQIGRANQVLDIAILVTDEPDCYQVLYHLHRIFQPIDGTLIDHLRDGRLNGLRTLQTSVLTNWTGQRLRLNFHIATHDRDHINRWGLVAIHFQQHPAFLPNAWWTSAQTGAEQIKSAQAGELPEILYVFSPQGQLFRFYRGATVVDYAYHVHTDLAHQCHRFYVNDEIVEPNTPLHHLDLVALEHDPFASGPTPVWLAAARTSKARSSIERFLKRRGLGVDQGQRILDQTRAELEAHFGFNLPDHRVSLAGAHAVRRFKVSRAEDLLTEIASGRISATQILYPLFAEEVIRQIRLPRGLGVRPHQVHLAQCCRPSVGANIVGLPTYRHGKVSRLRVHLATCKRIAAEVDTAVPLTWRLQPDRRTVAQLEVVAPDEDGLLGDAVRQVYTMLPHVTLHKVEAQATQGIARISFIVEATSEAIVEQLADELRVLPDRQIADVRKLKMPPSEIESALQNTDQSATARVVNPYSRLPVNAKSMFFGRGQELDTIASWLHTNVSNIWLLGQKRVGKTSILFHLKQDFLPQHGFVPAFIDFQLLGNLVTGNLFYEIANATYAELQHDPRIDQSGPPLRSLFEHQPPVQLITYLRDISERLAPQRVVLLLDEFSRTTDFYLQGQLERSFFESWRGLLQASAPMVSFITVIQQQTYDSLAQHAKHDRNDPSWHLMELGEKIVLKALDENSVRRLIEWPMRNFLEYAPESVETVANLTGGNPFLIQAFCFRLAAHMAQQDRRRVTVQDIEAVHHEFMLPTESVFSHFLDMIRGIGNQVSQQLAQLAQQHVAGNVRYADLKAQLPSVPEATLRSTLRELSNADILIALPNGEWRFSSHLFQQWLHLNAV